MSRDTIWVDGSAVDRIPISDRGLQYGDGLFETMTSIGGRVRWLDRHFARLRRGCERLEIPFDDYADLAREVEHASAQADRAIIKLTVTRGDGRVRGYAFRGDERPRRIVQRFEWSDVALPAARVGIANLRSSEQPALAGLKHLNRLENVLARKEAADRDLDEVLMCTLEDRVVGGAMTNVFLVNGRRLITPRVDRAGIAGITRERVLERARVLGFVGEERDVRLDEIETADALFLTNVRVGIWPVASCGHRVWNDHDASSILRNALEDATPTHG